MSSRIRPHTQPPTNSIRLRCAQAVATHQAQYLQGLCRVLVEQGKSANFINSVGLAWRFRTGNMLARDGKTVMDNVNAYGQEWQVLDSEPLQTLRLPQHPMGATCLLQDSPPSSSSRGNVIGRTNCLLKGLCEHWGGGTIACSMSWRPVISKWPWLVPTNKNDTI
jgi:hypothetical protein